jgi:hypothetical protein
MAEQMLSVYGTSIHSLHIVGSAVIPDYDEKRSDINSVVVLHSMDLKFIQFLAPLGRTYGKKGIAAPLVMTPEYIQASLDAFPIEFHDFRLIHTTIYGPDILKELPIDRPHVRLQAEREIKTRQIGLRQGYLSSLGRKSDLTAVLIQSFTGCMALFRAIIFLLGKEPPIGRSEVVSTLGSLTGFDTSVFQKMLQLKAGIIKPREQELRTLFEEYYHTLEAAGKIINELSS